MPGAGQKGAGQARIQESFPKLPRPIMDDDAGDVGFVLEGTAVGLMEAVPDGGAPPLM